MVCANNGILFNTKKKGVIIRYGGNLNAYSSKSSQFGKAAYYVIPPI
jgi:hypothetical protein